MTTEGRTYEYCCPRLCESKFSDEFKAHLVSSMAKLTDKEKRIHLFTMISLDEQVINRSKKSTKSRTGRFRYTVKEYGVLRRVCRDAFIRLHNTSVGVVRMLYVKMEKDKVLPLEDRGQHRKNRVPEKTQQLIKDHLFSVLESPAVSECSMKGLTSMGRLNKSKLWLDFKRKHVTGSNSKSNMSFMTYYKYINAFLTPEALAKFMSAQYAYKIQEKSLQILEKSKKNKANV